MKDYGDQKPVMFKPGKFIVKHLLAFVALGVIVFVVAMYGTPSQAAQQAAEADLALSTQWNLIIVSSYSTDSVSVVTISGFSTARSCASQVVIAQSRHRTVDAYCIAVQ